MERRLRSLCAGSRGFTAGALGDEPRRCPGTNHHRSLGLAEMSGPKSVWPAPAKLNLFLHILGRRPDGYHELQTCFQFVDLCDEITIEVRADGQIRRAVDIPGVSREADLCIRAARALKDAAGVSSGADIHLLKRIPIGGGLG